MSDNWWESAPVAPHRATTALNSLTSRGVVISNGYRTDADDARIRGQGYKPAANSLHKDRDAVDLLPGNSGLSHAELQALARQEFGEDAWIDFHDGHVHVQVPGWGAAPDVTRNPALREGDWWSDAPVANAPATAPIATPAPAPAPVTLPPPQPETQSQRIDHPTPVIDFNALTVGPTDVKTVVEAGSTKKTLTDPEAEGFITAMLRAHLPAAEAQRRYVERYPNRGVFTAAKYEKALRWVKQNPKFRGSMAAVTYQQDMGVVEAARNDFAQSAPGAITGHYANAVAAGIPVLIAGQEGNDFERVSWEKHPKASMTGGVGGAITGALTGGTVARQTIGAVAEGTGLAARIAQPLAARPGAVQAGVDLVMGSTYGAATAGPGNRTEGALLGAALTAGGEVLGRTVIAPAARGVMGRIRARGAGEAIPDNIAMAAEREPVEELVGEVGESGARPAQRELPLFGSTDTRTADDFVRAAENADPNDFAPNGVSAADPKGKVGNINLNHVETTDDISRVLKETEEAFGHDVARRGVQTHEATQQLADDLGMTADDLLSRQQGQALNAEQALAARQILAKSSEELSVLATAAAKNGGVEDLNAFKRALLRHNAIQEQVTGMTAEAGRALNQFRIAAQSAAVRDEVLRGVAEGTEADLKRIAQNLIDLADNPSAFNNFARNATKPQWKDKLVELYYASILSGPQTHAANIIGNSLATVTQPVEQALASGLGAIRAAAGKLIGRNVEDRVLMSEVGSRAVGMLQGVREGLRAGWKTARTGHTSDSVTKVEVAHQEAIGGLTGKIIRTPLRALSAEDEFFKAVARRMEISALAVKKARGEGLRGDAAKVRIAELTANPTPKMLSQSDDYARYMTFQKELGSFGTKMMGLTNAHPTLKIIVPFIRTPANIFKYAAERTPLALLSRRIRADLKAGGARRDVAVARIMVGTGLSFQIAEWAKDGLLTGNGPADPNAKRLLQADGWQPYSIKIGNTYYGYNRLDPFATIVGPIADFMEKQSEMSEAQADKKVGIMIGSIVGNIDNKSFMDGISDVFAAFEALGKGRPEEATRIAQQRISGIVVPAIVSQANQGLDPVWRDVGDDSFTAGLVDAIENRIPGLSDNNPPVRDALGRESVSSGRATVRALSPVKMREARNDPVIAAIRKSDASIGRLERRLKIDGVKRRLNDAEWEDYQRTAGQLTYRYISEEMNADDWNELTPEQQAKAINTAKRDARKEARANLFGDGGEGEGE